MNPVSHPLPVDDGKVPSAREWLDTLAAGACEPAAFMRAVDGILEHAPDDGWELLSLVDQYYRRGKITAELFRSLNAHLQSVLMGTARQRDAAQHSAARSAARKPVPTPAVARAPPQPPPLPSSGPVAQPAAAPAAGASAGGESARRPAIPSVQPRERAAEASTQQPPAQRPLPTAAPREPPLPRVSRRNPVPGDLLRGRYRIEAVLGRGNFGTVFKASDESHADPSGALQVVAVKVFDNQHVGDVELLQELRREFQDLQLLAHPNIVRVHEFDRDGDLAFFTMECLSGLLLSRVLTARDDAALFPLHALAILRDVGAALAHAHSRGVTHGDLNPGNIFVTDGGDVRLLNFGAAHGLNYGPRVVEFDATQSGSVMPSSFASCQILEGETPDPRDDMYAFACLACVLLSGRHPFQYYTAIKARTLRLTAERPAQLSRRQWQTLQAGLAFSRDARPRDMQRWLLKLDLKADSLRLPPLSSLLATPARGPRTAGWWLLGAAALLLAAGGWLAMHRPLIQPQLQWLRAQALGLADSARSSVADSVQRAEQRRASAKEGHAAAGRGTAPAAANRAASPVAGRAGSAAGRAAPPVPDSAGTPTAARTSAAGAAGAPMSARPGAAGAAGAPTLARSGSTAGPAGAAASGVAVAAAAATGSFAARATTAPPGTEASSFGRARVELAADTVDADTTDGVARVIVKRSGGLHGEAPFTWWTESGTAKPGRDFKAYAPQQEQFEEGQKALGIVIPIVADPARTQERSFYVVIDESGDGATIGARRLTMVTIPARE